MNKHLTTTEAAMMFASLSSHEQQEFLAGFAHGLTLLMRDCYRVGGEGLDNSERARLINEVQHQVLGQLYKLIANDAMRYPDDVLVRIIFDGVSDETLLAQMRDEFARHASRHAVTH